MEVDNGTCSKENFGGKFWQLDDASESLWRFGFVKVVQQFIYRGTTAAMGIGDISRAIATKNHSSDGRLQSSACC
jgi:hypothetical protein